MEFVSSVDGTLARGKKKSTTIIFNFPGIYLGNHWRNNFRAFFGRNFIFNPCPFFSYFIMGNDRMSELASIRCKFAKNLRQILCRSVFFKSFSTLIFRRIFEILLTWAFKYGDFGSMQTFYPIFFFF